MRNRIAAFAIAGLLGACSSESPGVTDTGVAGQVVGGLAGFAGLGRQAPAAETMAFDLTPQMLAETGGRVIMVRLANKGITAPMVLTGRNGGVSTFGGGGVVSLSLRDGVVLASRGFGDDLMTARVPTLHQLTTGPRSYRRSYELFDGFTRPQERQAQCNVVSAGQERLVIAGKSINARLVEETCLIDIGRIDNRYWVNGSGQIVRSRQWISPDLGYVEVLSPG
jgi:hypothetical protein